MIISLLTDQLLDFIFIYLFILKRLISFSFFTEKILKLYIYFLSIIIQFIIISIGGFHNKSSSVFLSCCYGNSRGGWWERLNKKQTKVLRWKSSLWKHQQNFDFTNSTFVCLWKQQEVEFSSTGSRILLCRKSWQQGVTWPLVFSPEQRAAGRPDRRRSSFASSWRRRSAGRSDWWGGWFPPWRWQEDTSVRVCTCVCTCVNRKSWGSPVAVVVDEVSDTEQSGVTAHLPEVTSWETLRLLGNVSEIHSRVHLKEG